MIRIVGAAARALTLEDDLELVTGEPPGDGSAFADDEDRRAAYLAHRNELGWNGRVPGQRPAAWWRYEPGSRNRPTATSGSRGSPNAAA